ncbi:MAG: STAS/SEC14 domain-containing protein [SAR324 cluster bacterium]|nr:STAS/SEC14 domain-containing protein [SAR324 cluster bacterium]
MFKKLEESSDKVLGFHISGKISTAEIDEIILDLETAIKKQGSIRLLVHMKDWAGMEAMAAFDDFHFLVHHIKNIEVLAVIGDKYWEKLILGIGALFVSTRSKYFEEDEITFAWSWIEGVPLKQ